MPLPLSNRNLRYEKKKKEFSMNLREGLGTIGSTANVSV